MAAAHIRLLLSCWRCPHQRSKPLRLPVPTLNKMAGSTANVTLTLLGVSAVDAGFCGLVYARSWPSSLAGSYSEQIVVDRLTSRGFDYWIDQLVRSPVRVAGELFGRRGFALVTVEPEGLEFSYLFVEPEAFGSGLAGVLYDMVMADGRFRPDHAWVLACNERSLTFFGNRGWRVDGAAGQPSWAAGFEYVRLVAPDC